MKFANPYFHKYFANQFPHFSAFCGVKKHAEMHAAEPPHCRPVLPIGRIFGRTIQKGPIKNMDGQKKLQPSFGRIFTKGADSSKVYFS
jgi:hypothetical protein